MIENLLHVCTMYDGFATLYFFVLFFFIFLPLPYAFLSRISAAITGADVLLCKQAGFDGGLRQWFLMEIFEQQSASLQANISSKYPVLSAPGLDSGRFFKIFVYAINLRGRSEPVLLEGYTLKAAEKQTVALTSYKGSQANFELTPILSVGIFVGILVAIICIGIGTLAALKLRSHKQQQKYQHQNQKFSRPGNLQIKDKISLPLSHSEEMYDEKNPDVVPYNEAVDGEYKQKSATQTPSGHLSTTSEAEISCKPPTDERGLYQSNKDEELHYAELSLAAGASSSNAKKTLAVDCSNSMLLQGTSNPSVMSMSANGVTAAAGTLPHGSTGVRKLLPSIPTTTKNSTLQRNKTGVPPPPPPTYDYFEEPTIYAQIDHYKTSTSAGNSSSASPFPPCISSPTSQGTPSTVSPGTVQMYTLPSHPGGYHTLPHNHHQPNISTYNSSTSVMQILGTATPSSTSSASNYQHGTLPMPPSYQQHQKQQQQLHLEQSVPPPLGQMLVSSNSSGLASATTTAAITSPSSSLSGLSAIGKSYSREIVTVRTPLMYSQQESCV
uniref:Uncharacterized protein n=1 Tax=Glossina brevipalpis TaxID=37001 RepID=A0A1A9WRF5_9MUSC